MCQVELKVFKDVNKEELSMIEVAHALLEANGDIMDFTDLVNQIQNYLGKADKDIREDLSQFYTDLNIDGSFISLGDNRWGLRSWYPIDSIDEEVSHFGDDDEDEEDRPRRKKRRKVNAFLDTDDEDAIDYNDDDPEDADDIDEDDEEYDDDEKDDEEIAEYGKDLSEIGADDIDEEDVPEGVEDELSIVDEDDMDDYDDADEDL